MILGGGVGGIVTANALRRPLDKDHRVVVVDRGDEHVFTPSLLWVTLGWPKPGQITRDLRRLLRPELQVIQAEVQEIDPDDRRVRTSVGELGYDYLLVGLGADLAPETISGFSETAGTPYDLAGAAGF